MTITTADGHTFWQTPLAENVPAPAPVHMAQTYLVDIYQATRSTAAQIGALTATVSALAKTVGNAGGLTAEQITAAAQAGAQAALAELGDALTTPAA